MNFKESGSCDERFTELSQTLQSVQQKDPFGPRVHGCCVVLESGRVFSPPQGNHRGALHIYEELKVSSLGRVLPGG